MKNPIIPKIFVFLLIVAVFTQLSAQDKNKQSDTSLNDLRGNWELVYDNSYGYTFKLGKNYRAIVIVYLNSSSIIFKGIYNIEDSDKLRINISEMKREDKIKDLNLKTDFLKVKSSFFIFQFSINGSGKSKKLSLRRDTISIDGSDSEGYFEPLIELDYKGK